MVKKEKNKSHVIILGSLFIIIGMVSLASKYISNYNIKKLNDKRIANFFNNSSINNRIVEDNQVEVKVDNDVVDNYIAVLEIPSINLKKGIFSKDNVNNNVDKNIQILYESAMPDELGNFILAGHSGSSNVSYFKNLDYLKNGDLIYVYYNNFKYIYKVVDFYYEIKDGDIQVFKNYKKPIITLTTCSQNDNESQLVVIGELINEGVYMNNSSFNCNTS